MRLLVCVLVALAVDFGGVESQRGGNNQGIRLGLINNQVGSPPVPGGHFSNPNTATNPSCFCLPPNQRCPDQPIPILTRIANASPAGATPQGIGCTNPEQKLCCPGGRPPIPGPGVRPQPVVPSPIQVFGSCGRSNPIQQGRSQLAEADFGEYPWMAVILDQGNNYVGGGALIAPGWVLTTAHRLPSNQLKARLGDWDVRSPQDHPTFRHIELPIARVIVHPSYNARTLANDIALLQLSQPINTNNFPHIGPACLPEQGQLFFTQSQSCWVSGWGKEAFGSSGSFQQILKEVDLPMVDPFVCQERLRESRLGHTFNLDQTSFLCAGGVAGKDACQGDGGAPLVCPTPRGWTVVGLVAWGIGCATGELPGVYVNVPNYVNFIRQYVRV